MVSVSRSWRASKNGVGVPPDRRISMVESVKMSSVCTTESMEFSRGERRLRRCAIRSTDFGLENVKMSSVCAQSRRTSIVESVKNRVGAPPDRKTSIVENVKMSSACATESTDFRRGELQKVASTPGRNLVLQLRPGSSPRAARIKLTVARSTLEAKSVQETLKRTFVTRPPEACSESGFAALPVQISTDSEKSN